MSQEILNVVDAINPRHAKVLATFLDDNKDNPPRIEYFANLLRKRFSDMTDAKQAARDANPQQLHGFGAIPSSDG